MVQLGERLRDRKPQARALMAFGELALDLLKRAAQSRERLLRNADAGIRDGDADPAAGRPRADRDAAASGVNFTALDSRFSTICLSRR